MKLIASILLTTTLLTGCASSLRVDGQERKPYGLVNEDERKVEGQKYQVSKANVVAGILLCETVVVPAFILGWQLWEPVGK